MADGKVLVSGGSSTSNVASGVAYTAKIWNPDTRGWTTAAKATKMRLYHSVSILLSDGRVLTAGGHAPTDHGCANHRHLGEPDSHRFCHAHGGFRSALCAFDLHRIGHQFECELARQRQHRASWVLHAVRVQRCGCALVGPGDQAGLKRAPISKRATVGPLAWWRDERAVVVRVIRRGGGAGQRSQGWRRTAPSGRCWLLAPA
jgi:hypothetical protein